MNKEEMLKTEQIYAYNIFKASCGNFAAALILVEAGQKLRKCQLDKERTRDF